jgi:DNA-directed RNA polymerase specialized sigma24 family protein
MSEPAVDAASPACVESLDFSTATDADLFEWMAMGDTCASDAHTAFAEFHRRHAKYVFDQCKKKYKDEAEAIAANALQRVYASAAKFERTNLGDWTDAIAARRFVRAWVGQQVRWAAADYFTDRQKLPQLVTLNSIGSLPSKPCVPPEEDTTGTESKLVEEVRRVVSELPEREQVLAWEIAHNWHPGEGKLKCSSEDLDLLGDRFGLTKENIRQIRSRLKRKLRTRCAHLVS